MHFVKKRPKARLPLGRSNVGKCSQVGGSEVDKGIWVGTHDGPTAVCCGAYADRAEVVWTIETAAED